MDKIESPCVRNCSLNNEQVCIGCWRKLDEIMAWGKASEEIKKEIVERIKNDNNDTNKHL